MSLKALSLYLCKLKDLILFNAIILLVFQHVFGQDNVVYGERPVEMNSSAIFLDQEGSLYPDYFISNESLIQSKAKLIHGIQCIQKNLMQLLKNTIFMLKW